MKNRKSKIPPAAQCLKSKWKYKFPVGMYFLSSTKKSQWIFAITRSNLLIYRQSKTKYLIFRYFFYTFNSFISGEKRDPFRLRRRELNVLSYIPESKDSSHFHTTSWDVLPAHVDVKSLLGLYGKDNFCITGTFSTFHWHIFWSYCLI